MIMALNVGLWTGPCDRVILEGDLEILIHSVSI